VSTSGRRVGAAVLVSFVAILGLALPAEAHITVSTDEAHQGASDALLTFRVPNEEDGATTVKVTISFPKANPLPSVKPAPKAGWAVSTSKITFNPPITTDDGTLTDGVGQIVYTASSAATGIPVGGFDTFQVLVGPLPAKADSLTFPTVQTYSDGKSVSWVQPITDPAHEPDNPAPTLHLLAAAAGSDAGSAGAAAASPSSSGSAAAAAAPAAGTSQGASADDVSGARRLAVIALVVAAVAVLAGIGGLLSGRRRT
jgi:uncharacterized protein YcnI